MTDTDWDVVVLGAGAAGLLAATRAAERGKRTLLLEKNRRPGVKILMSGGTRCNLTHATDNRGIVEAFGPPGRFLHSALAALSVASAIPRAIKTRPEKLKTSFQSSIEDFGSSTAILQTAGADVRWLLRASRRVMSVVYSGEREKAMIFCQICARSPPVKAVNKSAAVVNE